MTNNFSIVTLDDKFGDGQLHHIVKVFKDDKITEYIDGELVKPVKDERKKDEA